MRGHEFFAVAGALADHERANEARNTGIDVDDSAARKIKCAPLEEHSGIREDSIEIGLRGRLGGVIGCVEKRLGSARECIRTRPVPDHVRDREIDDGDPENDEHDQGRETDALCNRTDDQGRRDAGEGHLERHIGEFRNDNTVREGGDD